MYQSSANKKEKNGFCIHFLQMVAPYNGSTPAVDYQKYMHNTLLSLYKMFIYTPIIYSGGGGGGGGGGNCNVKSRVGTVTSNVTRMSEYGILISCV